MCFGGCVGRFGRAPFFTAEYQKLRNRLRNKVKIKQNAVFQIMFKLETMTLQCQLQTSQFIIFKMSTF